MPQPKITEAELMSKYNFIADNNGVRIYSTGTPDSSFTLEDTEPRLVILPDNSTIRERAWSSLYVGVVNWSIAKNKVTEDQMLKMNFGRRSHATLFTKEKEQVNAKQLTNGLYAQIFSANLSFLAIYDYLDLIGEDSSKCMTFVFKHPKAEPKEVRDFYIHRTKSRFNHWLLVDKKKSLGTASLIISTIESENCLLSNTAYNNFYLMPTFSAWTSVKEKYLPKAQMEYVKQPQKYEQIKTCLEYLNDFYKEYLS